MDKENEKDIYYEQEFTSLEKLERQDFSDIAETWGLDSNQLISIYGDETAVNTGARLYIAQMCDVMDLVSVMVCEPDDRISMIARSRYDESQEGG